MNEEELNHIAELELRKASLLAKNPRLQTIQNKIDKTLKEVGDNPVDRCTALNAIMLKSLEELTNSMTGLEHYIKDSNLFEMVEELRAHTKGLDTKE